MTPTRATLRPGLALLALLAALALGAGVELSHRSLLALRDTWPRNVQERQTGVSPQAARFVFAGYNELAADFYWSRLLIYYGDGLEKKTALLDLEPQLETVTTLDPWFYRPHMWGAHATTFRLGAPTQDEYRSSIRVIERALITFPDDYELNWLLGLRYFLDLTHPDPAEHRRLREKGAAYIEKAMRLPGAPPDLPLLAVSMRTRLGQRDRALRELREMILTTSDDKARAQLLERYRAMVKAGAEEVEQAATEFERERAAALPYAPPSLFVILGPRPPLVRARDLAAGERVELEPAP